MAHRRDTDHPDQTGARHSGAPEAGGATSRGSRFGGRTLLAHVLRAVARVSRSVEATVYRMLRDLDQTAPEPGGFRGRPNRVRDNPS